MAVVLWAFITFVIGGILVIGLERHLTGYNKRVERIKRAHALALLNALENQQRIYTKEKV